MIPFNKPYTLTEARIQQNIIKSNTQKHETNK